MQLLTNLLVLTEGVGGALVALAAGDAAITGTVLLLCRFEIGSPKSGFRSQLRLDHRFERGRRARGGGNVSSATCSTRVSGQWLLLYRLASGGETLTK
jgi:hypothetical protein